ncbi:hypothetical protein [Kitasatospora paranensis]|uniref:Uncharacterized protein n=1 Tax=Kitasatospora paranensis TaxID=258053 RepID=A0ABW2FRV5_9ACTN
MIGWDAVAFRLAAGYDLCYHHGLELVFADPAYVACPTAFQDPVFRAPTPEEAAAVARRLGGTPPVLVAFEADAGGPQPVTCLIAAATLDVVTGTVLRHRPERLAPGERVTERVAP